MHNCHFNYDKYGRLIRLLSPCEDLHKVHVVVVESDVGKSTFKVFLPVQSLYFVK